MRNIKFNSKFLLFALFLGGFSSVYAEDLVFNSFEEAQKAAEQRSAEYDRRMAEQMGKVDNAWEKQNQDLGNNTNLDISKITESRETEQTSQNQRNTDLQNSVENSINSMKQQMVNSASANTVGFAGAAAGYSWKVKYVNGKYVLSDTYDQAFFVSGRSGNETTNTTTGGKELDGSGNKDNNDSDTGNGTDNPPTADIDTEDPTEVVQNPGSNPNEGDPTNPSNPSSLSSSTNPEQDPNNPNVKPEMAKADRIVEISIQHPVTFEEKIVKVEEGKENHEQLPNGFSVPEDTRVKISAKANKIPNTYLTMKIQENDEESDEIDEDSMRNYRHMFRLPSKDKYFVNIYVNYDDDPQKTKTKQIAHLCLPVEAVEFDSKMMSRE
jgi:hypothetical protein